MNETKDELFLPLKGVVMVVVVSFIFEKGEVE